MIEQGRRTTIARALVGLLLAGVSLAVTVQSEAAVIYDNLNGRQYQKNGVWYANFTNASCGSTECVAIVQDFDIPWDFVLGSISMPLGVNKGAANSVRISLYASNGAVPSSVLESWVVTNEMVEFNPTISFPSEVMVTSLIKPVLTKGTTYFIGFDVPAVSPDFVYGPMSSVAETRIMAISRNHGQSWTPYLTGRTDGFMAMRIEGDRVPSTVPEPASLLLVTTGLAGAAIRRLRAGRHRSSS